MKFTVRAQIFLKLFNLCKTIPKPMLHNKEFTDTSTLEPHEVKLHLFSAFPGYDTRLCRNLSIQGVRSRPVLRGSISGKEPPGPTGARL